MHKIFLTVGNGVTSSVLKVSISINYTSPSAFNRPAPYYRAASPISLTCEPDGISGSEAFYSWTSNCSGNCFTVGHSSETVSTHYLEPSDTGVHTCNVYGLNGETGSANVTISVVGKFVQLQLPTYNLCKDFVVAKINV